ncbi:MAG: DUF1045 domain-containing protein [Pseudomonadota bacterium]
MTRSSAAEHLPVDHRSATAPGNQRYAIYFAPADDSPLGQFGASVLRRHSHNLEPYNNPDLPYDFNNTDLWLSSIKKPAHYGFHATLKAPFELADGQSAESLLNDVADFCSHQKTLSLRGLKPRRTRRFDALAFEHQPEDVHHFANTCVVQFEKYRAPLSVADHQRRHKEQLSPEQTDYLNRYGYPYVFNQFNFHMTLSGTQPDDANGWLQWLRTIYPLMVSEPPVLDRLSVFHQPDRQTPFVRIAEFCFGA